MSVVVLSVDHIVLNVTDVEASAAWFHKVLGMTREEWDGSRTAMKFGTQKINLRPAASSKKAWFTTKCAVAGSDDLLPNRNGA